MSPWATEQRSRRLEVGANIVQQRSRGAKWTDLAESFGLGDEHAARKLAVGYLLSLAELREAAGEAADDTQDPPATSGTAAERSRHRRPRVKVAASGLPIIPR